MRVWETRRRIRPMLAVVAALAVLMAACGGNDTTADNAGGGATSEVTGSDWNAVVAAAEQEGKVTLYSTQVLPILTELEKKFEATYPKIDLEVVRGLPQDLIPKLEAERLTGNATGDFYVNADYQWTETAGETGFFAKPVGPNFDANGYDRATNVSDAGYFLTHAVVFGWAWNTDKVPNGLDSYEDLLSPELAGGKIGVVEASNQALTDFWTYLEANLGAEFVTKLADQEPRIYAGGSPLQEALISGEVVASVYAGSAMDDAVAKGAPVNWKVPQKPWGARYWAGALAIAPHPNAAQVLGNFLISPEGQAVVAKGNAATLANIPGTRVDVDNVPVQDTDKLTPDFVAQYGQKWKGLFQ